MATRKVIKISNGEEVVIEISEKLALNAGYMTKHNLKLAPTVNLVTEIFSEEEDPEPEFQHEEAEIEEIGIPGEDYKTGPESVVLEEGEPEEEEYDIKADVLSLSNEELIKKYKKDDWVALGKELNLSGNLGRTGEEKLINRIKDKLQQ